MKTSLLKKLRQEFDIKHTKKAHHLLSKDGLYYYEMNDFNKDWIWFFQCYLLLSMNKFVKKRKLKNNKKAFNNTRSIIKL